jgi:hypothetical protein
MKKINSFIVVAGLVFITTYSYAQTATQNKNASDADKLATQMTAVVKQTVTGVTPDQEKQILAAEQDYSKGVLDVKSSIGNNSNNLSSDDKMAKYNQIKSLTQTRDAKIKTILTADQYSQYQKVSPPMSTMAPGK